MGKNTDKITDKTADKNKAKLEFETLEFEYHKPDKCEANGFVRVYFMRSFYFDLYEQELLNIGNYKILQNGITFNVSQHKAERKFDDLLIVGFNRLKSRLTGKKTIYIHKNSGIPLIGNNTFGIVDRNSSLIEVKPVTGCNLLCVFCSVDQDKRSVDFVIEKDYLVQELKKLIEFKEHDGIQVFIGSQGEPLIYTELAGLIKDISEIKYVKEIILSTNGTLITEKQIDEFAKAGLTRINLSLNALHEDRAKKICGPAYNLKHVKKIAEYIPKKIDLMITPVWTPGLNDDEIEPMIKYAIKIGAGKKCPPLGIQKFLEYQYGKTPMKEESWDTFYEKLEKFEKKYHIKLARDFGNELKIVNTKKLPKPFDKGDFVSAEIKCDGRMPGEKIAVSGNRSISIMGCPPGKKGHVRIKIARSKHNVFIGNLA